MSDCLSCCLIKRNFFGGECCCLFPECALSVFFYSSNIIFPVLSPSLSLIERKFIRKSVFVYSEVYIIHT